MKRKPLIRFIPFRLALLVAPLLAAWPQYSRAGSASWNLNNTGTWSVVANWSPNNTFPNGTADVANFLNDISAARTINLVATGGTATNFTVNDLNIGDSNASHGFTIAPGVAGSTLIFGGSNPSIDIVNGATHTISAPLQFNADMAIRSQTGQTHVFSGGMKDGGVARVISFNNDTNGTARPAGTTEGAFNFTTVAAAFNAGTTINVNDVRLGANFAGALGTSASNTITVTGNGQLYISGATHVNNLVLDTDGWNEAVGNLGAARLENGTVSGSVTLMRDTTLSNNANNVGTLSGAITGAFNITKVGGTTTAGQGVLQLSGDNSGWSGNLTVNRGTVRLSNPPSQGTGTSILVDGSHVPPVGNFSSGQLGAQLDLAGAGGTFGTGKTLTLKSGLLAQNYRATLQNQAGSNTWAGPITLDSAEAGGSLIQIPSNGAAGTTMTIDAPITANATTYPGLVFFRGSREGVITPAATFNMPNTDWAKTDAGTWTIQSTGNIWRDSIVADGTVALGATNALDPTGNLILGQTSGTTGQLDLKDFSQTVGSLTSNPLSSSAGLIIKNTGVASSTLTFTTTALTDAFKGTLSGNVSLVKNGSGVFTFNSTTPSVVVPAWTAGSIQVNSGEFALTGGAILGDATTSVNVADGATLSGEGSLGGSLTLGSATGTTLEVDGSSAGALTVNALNPNAAVQVSSTSGFSPAGKTRLVNVPSAPGGLGTAAFSAAGLNLRSPAFSYDATIPAGVDLTYTSAPLRWNGTGGAVWDVATTASWQDSVPTTMAAMNGDNLTLDDLPAVDQSIAVTGTVQPGSITFDNSAAVKYTLTAGAGANIATPILKQNTGTAVIAYNNPSTQPLTITGGTVKLGDGGTEGSVAGPVINDAALVFDHGTGAVVTVPGVISGAGSIAKQGAGTTVLTGVSTNTGNVSVTAGILEVDRDSGNLANASIDVAAPGTLLYSRNDGTIAFDRVVTGNGTVAINPHSAAGSATAQNVTITSASPDFTGTWLLQAPVTGTYRINAAAPAAFGSGSIDVKSGAQVFTASGQTYPNNITIAGTGFTDGAGNIGALRLENTSIWSGNVTVDAAGARIGAHNGTGTISGNISGGPLEFNATNYNNNYTVILTGSNSYTTTTIGGVNTQTTGVPSYRLNIGSGGTTGSLGSGPVVINGDGANGVLGFDRSDGYTLATGQSITAAGSNLARTFIDFDTTGSGFSDNGQTIDLGTAGGVGGSLRFGQSRADTVSTLTGTAEAGIMLVGAFNASVPTTNASLTLGNGANVSVTQASIPAGGGTTPLGNSSGAVLTVASGASLSAVNYIYVGDANTGSGTVNHSGSVTVGNQLRVGHWPNALSTYNMTAGSLMLTGDSPLLTPSTAGGGGNGTAGDNNVNALATAAIVGGGIYLGNDGTGVLNHTGGTITTNWIVLDNRANSTAGGDGIDRYNISGSAILKLRSEWGLVARNVSTDVSLGGGTIQVDNTGTGGPAGNTGADLDVPLDAVLNTVAATTTKLDTNGADNSFILTRDVSGSGVLDLDGGGTVEFRSAAAQTVAAGLSGSTAIIKTGAGTTTIAGNSSAYAGNTSVEAGTLVVDNSLGGSQTVKSGATLTGLGIAGAVTVQSGGIVSPGTGVAALGASSADLQAGSRYDVEVSAASTADKLNVSGAVTANGTVKVTLSGYVPVAGDSFDIVDAASITGAPVFDFSAAVLSAGLVWDTSAFLTTGTISVITDDPFTAWAQANSVTGGKSGDDDNDGATNLLEFATNANPKTNGSGARAYGKLHLLAGENVLTLTVAVRKNATFGASGSKQTATQDKVIYNVEASDDLVNWNTVVVSELSPADAAAVQASLPLPALDADWEWHSFRTDDSTALDPRDMIRLSVTAAP